MTVLGLTGPLGAGKSVVLDQWAREGAYVIDCDKLYHDLLSENAALLSDIEKSFPGVVKNGALDRRALGAIVFNDKAALERLNAITHPRILEVLGEALSKARSGGFKAAAVEALYLPELAGLCDVKVCLTATPEERLRRVMKRDSFSEETARARIDSQQKDIYFINACDIVIVNDGSEEVLREKAREIYLEVAHG